MRSSSVLLSLLKGRLALLVCGIGWAAVILSGCCSVTLPNERELSLDVPTLLSPSDQDARGVLLFVHGLNLNPAAMLPLRTKLLGLGYPSYQVVLSGHSRIAENDEPFDASRWRDDVVTGYREVRRRYPQLPVYIVGYSLGGLLAVDVVQRYSDITPRGLVLIAPAVSLHTVIEGTSLLQLFPALAMRVPNIAPEGYRRFSKTPLFWYQNTMSLYWDLAEGEVGDSQLAQIPALVFLNPSDELVSCDGVKSWIAERGLQGRWSVEVAHPIPEISHSPKHLMIDEDSLGRDEWQRMVGTIEQFLQISLRETVH